tara:strand:- start:57547 stop:58794 length:1248 start_codon:yes stop_codon:yes gene_type:complete
MPMDRRDIVIAGGGMVGISLALLLAEQLPATRSITLVEGFRLPPAAGRVPDYHPAFDARSTALSYRSRSLYEQCGVWETLRRHTCAIETIHVSSRGRFGSSLLRASEHDWPALGHVVENPWLGQALLHVLRGRPGIELLNPARVVEAQASAGGMRLQLEGEGVPPSLDCQLLVVADGAESGLRDRLGIAVERKPYGQHALICNVATDRPHAGCAFERFTDQGPMALLPLRPAEGVAHRSALVWTLPPERADTLVAAADEAFLGALGDRFGYRLGRFLQASPRQSYPLALLRSEEQVRRGLVIMGNAAHALHPVAGQGFNLALRDCAALAETLGEAVSRGQEPGELSVLQTYARRQRGDQRLTIGFSDLLPALFMQSDPVLGMARDLALSGLDWVAPFKKAFVRQAAGMRAGGMQA